MSSGLSAALCPRLVIARRVDLKRLWQKLTVFEAGANRSTTLRSRSCNDEQSDGDGCDAGAQVGLDGRLIGAVIERTTRRFDQAK